MVFGQNEQEKNAEGDMEVEERRGEALLHTGGTGKGGSGHESVWQIDYILCKIKRNIGKETKEKSY